MTLDKADQRAAPGFSEFRFDDGALIQISAYGGTVSVLQMQASTQGRGAAFLTVDEAAQLADAVTAAAAEAKKQNDAAPTSPATVQPQSVGMPAAAPAAGLTAADIAAIVNAALDARGVTKPAG